MLAGHLPAGQAAGLRERGWEGDKARCRACSGTGSVELRFVETTLPDGTIWHHPWDRYDAGGREIAAAAGLAVWNSDKGGYRTRDGNEPLFWNISSDWVPRRPGEHLDVDTLAPRPLPTAPANGVQRPVQNGTVSVESTETIVDRLQYVPDEPAKPKPGPGQVFPSTVFQAGLERGWTTRQLQAFIASRFGGRSVTQLEKGQECQTAVDAVRSATETPEAT